MLRRLRIPALFALSVPLLANTGIPMVFITIPMMGVALIPIVLIETGVVRWVLKEGWWKTARTMFTANLITTMLGLPISNLIAYLIYLCSSPFLSLDFASTHRTILKAFIANHWFNDVYLTFSKDGSLVRPFPREPAWYFAVAVSFAFFINLFISFYLEYRYMKPRFSAPNKLQKKASLLANTASYLFLLISAIVLSRFRS